MCRRIDADPEKIARGGVCGAETSEGSAKVFMPLYAALTASAVWGIICCTVAYAGQVHDNGGWTASMRPTKTGAEVTLYNAQTAMTGTTETITVDTAGISITLAVTHTANIGPETDDLVEVIGITPGWLAIPASLSLPELQSGKIIIVPNVVG